jgi:hypothetical protein
MAKKRVKFQTTLYGKKYHKTLLNSITGIRDVSVEKNRFNEYFIYFTTKNEITFKKAEFELEKHGIQIQIL